MFIILTQGAGGRDEEAAVSRYSSQYEQRLDPFSAFNQRVSDVLVPPRTRTVGKTQSCFFSCKHVNDYRSYVKMKKPEKNSELSGI